MNKDHGPELTSSQLVYSEVKSALTRGERWLDDKFFDSSIANRFGVSRTPAREALSKLLVEGLLTRSGRTYSVREFSVSEIHCLYQLREELECLSVRKACERRSQCNMDVLENLVVAMDKCIDSEEKSFEFSQLDQEYHLAIAEMSGNVFLLEAMYSIQNKSALVRGKHLLRQQSRLRAQVEHKKIIEAFSRELPLVAEAEMRYHIRSSIEAYLRSQDD
nr:GntR family transcriptional regulator [Ruegeria atlantica]